MPPVGFTQMQISGVALQWEMPLQNQETYYPVNMSICIYTALANSGHTLWGQQTSVKCQRYTEFV